MNGGAGHVGVKERGGSHEQRVCRMGWLVFVFFFFKQKTAYEIGTGDWSSDVCSSDLMVTSAGFIYPSVG